MKSRLTKAIENLVDEILFCCNQKQELPTIEEEVETNKKIIGYIPDWVNTPPKEVIKNFTHITDAFLTFDDKGFIQKHKETSFNYENIKRGVAFGGWAGKEQHLSILSNPTSRKNFVNQLVSFCLSKKYDYITIDLEYPPNETYAENLVNDFVEVIGNKNIKLHCCVGAWTGFSSPYRNCVNKIDCIEIMNYGHDDIKGWTDKSLADVRGYGYKDNQIAIGFCLDDFTISDTEETMKYKRNLTRNSDLNEMYWYVNPAFFVNNQEVEKPVEEEKQSETKEGEETKDDIVWKSNFNNPYYEMIKAHQRYIYDEKCYQRGDGKLAIENGILKMSGREPRLYIDCDIQDVEVEMEARRMNMEGVGWSASTIGVRSHPEGHASETDKAHTYYNRVYKKENKTDFYKEVQHGGEQGIIKSVNMEYELEKWYKIKFRCYNLEFPKVKLESYVNDVLVLEHIDEDERMFNARGLVFIRNSGVRDYEYKNISIKKLN